MKAGRSPAPHFDHTGLFVLLVCLERPAHSMKKRSLSDQQRRTREQQERDRERILFGTQGAASGVRRVDVASVDTAALVAQLDRLPIDKKTGS